MPVKRPVVPWQKRSGKASRRGGEDPRQYTADKNLLYQTRVLQLARCIYLSSVRRYDTEITWPDLEKCRKEDDERAYNKEPPVRHVPGGSLRVRMVHVASGSFLSSQHGLHTLAHLRAAHCGAHRAVVYPRQKRGERVAEPNGAMARGTGVVRCRVPPANRARPHRGV